MSSKTVLKRKIKNALILREESCSLLERYRQAINHPPGFNISKHQNTNHKGNQYLKGKIYYRSY